MLRRRVGKEEEEEPNHNLNHNHEVQPSSDSSSRDNSQSKSQFKSKSDTDSPAAARPSHSKRSESFIHKPRSKRRNGLIFALGGLFGVLVAVLFANQQDVISLDSLMDFNIESLMEVMPHGFLNDAREFTVRYLFCRRPSEIMWAGR